MKKIALLATLAFMMLANNSCDKENTDYRPDFPPFESLVMDFSDFDTPPVQKKVITYTYDNFIHAYTNVAFWNGLINITMALPVAAYYNVQLSSGNPEYLGDNRWRWTKEFTLNQISYKAILTAERLNNQEFSMEMKIALAALPNQGVVWFDGVIRYDHTHATWNLYKNEPTHVKVLEIEWNKDYETGASDITYTSVEPGSDMYNNYIEMGIVPGADYDAYYTISLVTGVINVEWDLTSKAGRIMDPVQYEDSNWHCWSDQLYDIDCTVK